MNENLEFIKSVIKEEIKEEIKTWSGYQRQIVDDTREEEFIKEISEEVFDYIDITLDREEVTKETILEVLDDLMTDRLFPF